VGAQQEPREPPIHLIVLNQEYFLVGHVYTYFGFWISDFGLKRNRNLIDPEAS
jgi:hypothetical protein